MKTVDFIDFLSNGPEVLPVIPMVRRYTLYVLSALMLSALMNQLIYGIRADLILSMHEPYFWIKIVFCASLALPAYKVLFMLGHPGSAIKWLWWAMALPLLLMCVASAWVLSNANEHEWGMMILGQTWRSCPFNITLLSLPLMIFSLWLGKSLAPTHLLLTGACAGFFSGASAAVIYCLHCPESSVPFITLWYSLGVCLSTACGAYLGPKSLRW